MAYRIAGILLVLLGGLAAAAPRRLLERRLRKVRAEGIEVTDERVLMMRVAGVCFLGIGVGFLVGVHYGILA